MVRNDNDDWTVLSESTGVTGTTETSSFVDLGSGAAVPIDVLAMTATARNEWVGHFSDKKTAKICVKIKACELPEKDEEVRSAVDVVVALDVSSSMVGDKIRDCKKTLELMLRHLTSKDRFGLICYGSDSRVQFPVKFMTPENKRSALEKVKNVVARGSTNLSGGLFLAAQEMKQIEKPSPVQSIFLLTDGLANLGITDTGGLVAMVKSFADEIEAPADEIAGMDLGNNNDDDDSNTLDSKPKDIIVNKPPPISLYCFGYGAGHNSTMLQELANATSGGAYYFVEKDSDVASAFGDAMGGMLSVVAQSCVATFSVPKASASKGVQIVKVYHDQAIKRDNGTYTINVGDFYAEESRDIILDVSLASVPSETPLPHLQATLSYMDTINKKPVKLDPVQCLIGRPSNNGESPVNPEVELQWLRVQTIQQIQLADSDAQSNNVEGARQRMNNSLEQIRMSPVYDQSSPVIMTLMTDVQSCMDGFRSHTFYQQQGKHTLKTKGYALQKQRCMESSAASANAYRSKKKAAMSRAFATAPPPTSTAEPVTFPTPISRGARTVPSMSQKRAAPARRKIAVKAPKSSSTSNPHKPPPSASPATVTQSTQREAAAARLQRHLRSRTANGNTQNDKDKKTDDQSNNMDTEAQSNE